MSAAFASIFRTDSIPNCYKVDVLKTRRPPPPHTRATDHWSCWYPGFEPFVSRSGPIPSCGGPASRTGVPRSSEPHPPVGPHSSPMLRDYGDPWGAGVSYERCTPVPHSSPIYMIALLIRSHTHPYDPTSGLCTYGLTMVPGGRAAPVRKRLRRRSSFSLSLSHSHSLASLSRPLSLSRALASSVPLSLSLSLSLSLPPSFSLSLPKATLRRGGV